MSTEPKVSVIMPSLNVGEYIRECIDSVVNQTLENIEIICVDAGSTDGTLEVLEEYAARDKRITIIHSDKKSYGYQMNLGLKAATGEYFAILETDDYIVPDMYETLCPIADKHQLDVLKADFCAFVGDGDKREFTYRPMIEDKSYYNRVIYPAQELQVFKANNVTWCGLYRMDFLRENNILWNESPGASYQDNGFWFQTLCQAHRVMFYDKPFYMLRRDNPNSSVKSKAKVYCICGEYDYIRNILRKDPALEQKFAPICALYRLRNYNWTIDRVADEFKLEFIQRYAHDFRQIQAAGELDERLFTKDQWNRLTLIMKDPDGYYESRYAKKEPVAASKQTSPEELRRSLQMANRRIAALNQEIKDIQSSWTYRIGRFITWLPRKVRGGLRCFQEHGFRYTLERVLVHLHLKKDPYKLSSPAPKPQPAPASTSKPAPAPKPQPVKRDYEYYSKLPPEKYEEELKLWFKRETGKALDLDAPKSFSEKIQWMKLYDSTPIKTRLADKYLVRDWVKEKIGEEYLIPLLGVWDSFDEIDFDQLPDQFVLKANHGSGWNIIVSDKSKFDKAGAKKKFDVWMHKNYAFPAGLEMHYLNIPPKIIAEQYIEEVHDLYDYKFMCFHGEVKFIWVDTERFTNHKRTLFTTEWERRAETIKCESADYDIPRPKSLEQMVSFATKLCQGFAHVRVDFYEVNGKIYFGEMTFTSGTGTEKTNPPEFDFEMGSWIQLPPKSPLPERKF